MMLEKKDFRKGQKVYTLRMKREYYKNGAMVRIPVEERVNEKIVVKVGTKYVTVGNDDGSCFTGDEQYAFGQPIQGRFGRFLAERYGSGNYGDEKALFLSMDDLLEEEDRTDTLRMIKAYFDHHENEIPYEKLKRIQKILEEKE